MGSSPRIIMGKTGAEVVAGETARYLFAVETGGRLPAATEFVVSSNHARFNPRWARVIRATDDRGLTQYLLEVMPVHVRRDECGSYLLRLRWDGGPAEAWCELFIKPADPGADQPEVSSRAARDAGAMTR
jgi:hypothetical protein